MRRRKPLPPKRRVALLAASALLCACMTGASALAGGSVEEPAGYRLDDYRAPTPKMLLGAMVLDDFGARALWQERNAVFLDVMPQPPRPEKLPPETIWRQAPRETISGSIWLPNVGYGQLSDQAEAYFRNSLATLTGGDLSRTLVLFCLRDCWMSWNAAKRAMEYGYKSVAWYPAGVDGWREIGGALASVAPYQAP